MECPNRNNAVRKFNLFCEEDPMKSNALTMRAMILSGLLLFPAPAALAQGVALFAVLVGGNVVGGAGRANLGSQSGFGSITLIVDPTPTDPASERLCYGMAVRGIGAPTAVRIHRGRAGVNGPIAAILTAPNSGNPGVASRCVNAPTATVQGLINRPSSFYVIVYNRAFPNGALRGQLN